MTDPAPAPRFRDEPKAVIPKQVRVEASQWVARLHGPDRSRQMELDCLAWQAKSAVNRLAFERCTDTWEALGGIKVSDVFAAASIERKRLTRRSDRFGWAFAAAGVGLVVLAAAVGLRQWWSMGLYETGVGEQRSVLLSDGSRMSLNTASRVRVGISDTRRNIDVQAGEAMFEVAKDPARPFVVRVSQSEVVALGTSFIVRSPDGIRQDVTVTLVSGAVSVQPAVTGSASFAPVVMKAGERLRVDEVRSASRSAEAIRVDRPPMDQALAWQRHQAVFDGATIAEAVAEMNRYSVQTIRLVGADRLNTLRVTGTYGTGDIEGFARAVAAVHGLQVKARSGGWELSPAS